MVTSGLRRGHPQICGKIQSHYTRRGSWVDSMSTLFASCSKIDSPVQDILSRRFFPSVDSRRASCQLMAKERAFNTGKLPLGGLPRNSVVK